MKKSITIVANWKMMPANLSEAKVLFEKTKKAAKKYSSLSVVVCPPAVFLGALKSGGQKGYFLGAQNMSGEKEGAYTGEVSSSMLKSLGVSYVIVGHSERRAMGETDAAISQKLRRALLEDLSPILCIGERSRDKDGNFFEAVKQQLERSLADVPAKLAGKLLIAYEPLWAIGEFSKGAITPRDLHEMIIFIRKTLVNLYGRKAISVPILYGGSVDDANAPLFIKEADAAGLLVGRTSWNALSFENLLRFLAKK